MRAYDTEVSGLCVRVMASGLASFVFIRRPKGSNKPREVTIGRCGEMSVEKARQIARNLSTEFAAPDYLSSKAKSDSIPSFQTLFVSMMNYHFPKNLKSIVKRRLVGLDVTPSKNLVH